MVSTNDIRPGQSILLDGTLYLILEYQHVKPGKGKAFVKTKLKNLSSGGVVDKTFRADEDVQQAFIDKQQFQYLYKDGESYIFMN
ncbi:elongation factor P, partial [Acidimicrobiaceae bacterium]|nr:elongation factor P [Acidimicrobiaceae bacterium]